jgi:site-specific recombinase XerD
MKEQKNLAASTINVRLAAVRRLTYEAADNGILSPELAAESGESKAQNAWGFRIGHWLTVEQARVVPEDSCPETLGGKRHRAMIAVLLGCSLRRAAIVELTIKDLQVRENRWVFAISLERESMSRLSQFQAG